VGKTSWIKHFVFTKWNRRIAY